MRVAVYPGTFDPVTNGHMDMIRRGRLLCDRLVVAVATNPGKGPLFSVEERVGLVQQEVAGFDGRDGLARVEVKPFGSLLMHFAVAEGAQLILRGLRAVSDFDYEFQMAGMNHRLNPDVETVFLMSGEAVQFISSRFVKEIARLGGNVGGFIPPRVLQALTARLAAEAAEAAAVQQG